MAASWHVLNLFAYTGSLGIAALAGGAEEVVQVDRNKRFLEIARRSAILNRLDLGKMRIRANDFFREVGSIKRVGELFDCVIVDPPIFSKTRAGTVDLVNEGVRVINKVRPLVRHGGFLVVINNALYLRGKDFMRSLGELCLDGYLAVKQIIPVPKHVTGYDQTIVREPPTDPSPFNHPTKIVILQVKRRGISR
jgi:23S rRNA (cytosine1962-C5)-methyltransferase